MKRSLVLLLLTSAMAFAQAARPAGPAKPATPKTAAAAKSAGQAVTALPTEATVDSFIKHYFGYNPSLTWKVDAIRESAMPGLAEVLITFAGDPPQRMRMFVTSDGEHAIVGDDIPFGADPFKDERVALEQKADGPARGPAKAPVLIVEFSDLQCPHCKAAHPTIERLLADEPQARFVFQNFPLPMHDWAQKAAQYADCVGQKSNAAFWKFLPGVFEAQESITAADADAKLAAIATASGADGTAVAACAALPATAERVKKSFVLGTQVGVTGTPAMFVNGRRISSIGGLPYEELKAIVDFEIEMAQPASK